MDTTVYAPPVDKLLTLGEPEESGDKLPDYFALGIGPEQIPDLIRLALDNELRYDLLDAKELDEQQELAFWGPYHAIHALGQLRAEAAIEPLLTLFDIAEKVDDEWTLEDLPDIYSMIGPAALPALATFISDPSHPLYARTFASNAIVAIGNKYPEARSECIAAVSRVLEQYEENDYELNGLLIADLLHLKAVEAAPLIEQAFEADRVEEFIVGDWEDVQVELGLKEPSEEQRHSLFDMLSPSFESPPQTHIHPEDIQIEGQVNPSLRQASHNRVSNPKKKSRDKIAKASRKKNRRKK